MSGGSELRVPRVAWGARLVRTPGMGGSQGVEGPLPVPGNLDSHLGAVGLHPLAGLSVAGVAAITALLGVLLIAQVRVLST